MSIRTGSRSITPTDFTLPPEGVHIRWPDDWLGQEKRVVTLKQPAALAYWRANRLDKVMLGRPDARFGIVTVGKSYLDVRQALDELGIDDAEAERLGLAIYKVGMVWPLETEGATAFSAGKREILVVEEKRPLIEQQLKDALFNMEADRRPVVVGKTDERGAAAAQVRRRADALSRSLRRSSRASASTRSASAASSASRR